jgi:transglutaminase-like putative cysteine protease
MTDDLNVYLRPTPILNFDTKEVQDYAAKNSGRSDDPKEQAMALYYAVRDQIRYDPYKFDLTVHGLCASTTIRDGRAWCVPKAALLAACCRFLGIPARTGFADVKNHLSTARMRNTMQTNVFYWHGYTSIYLERKWVKATPAFNIELCEKFQLVPLEFDGENDSIYHSFDLVGNRHMEYLRMRGEFDDIPIKQMKKTFDKHYGGFSPSMEEADFDNEVDIETAGKK